MEPSPFDLLGRSIVADEHKGTYAVAGRLLDDAERAGVSLDRVLLARGAVELLAGAPGAARATFDRLRLTDPDLGVLLPAYLLDSLAVASVGLSGLDVTGVPWFGLEPGPLWSHDRATLARSQEWTAAVQRRAGERSSPGMPVGPGLVGLLTARLIWSSALDPAAADTAHAMSLAEEELDPDDHTGWGFLLRVRAEQARIGGDDATARRLLEESAGRYRQGGDLAGAASCDLLAGDWLLAPGASPLTLGLLDQRRVSSAGRWRSCPTEAGRRAAEESYRRAERGFADCPRGLAALALRRSYLAALRDDADGAMASAGQAAREFESCGDERGFWIASTHLALHRLAAGVPVDAAFAEELPAWGLGRGSPALAYHLGALTGTWGRYLLHERGDVRAALRCHAVAGEIHGALGAVVSLAVDHVAAAEAHSCAGDQQRAALSAEDAVLALAPALHEDHPLLVLALHQLPAMALQGLSMRYASTFDHEGLAGAVRRLAPMRDRFHALLEHHARAVAASADEAESFPMEHRLAREQLGFARKVAPILDYVLAHARWQVPWLRAARLTREGSWSQAERELEALLARCRADGGKVPHELAPYALLGLGRRREAEEAFDEIADGYGVLSLVEVPPPSGGPEYDSATTRRFHAGLQRLSFLTAAHGFDRAAEVIDELAGLRGEQWWRYAPEPWSWLAQIATTAAGTGRLAEAAEWYTRAVDALESRRFGASRDSWQASYYGTPTAALTYVGASRCALRAGRAEEALELSERGRARATADLLAAGAGDPLVEAWRAADARSTVWHNHLHQARAQPDPDQRRLSQMERAAAEADRELAARERDLAARSPLLLLPSTQRAPGPATRLAAGTALVAYRLHDDGLLVWAITRDEIVVAEEVAVDVPVFVERIRLLREACTGLADDWHEHAAAIAETVLTPVAQVLRAHRRLLVVPSGPLHGLPFPALPWNGQPLVARHEISVLPAAFLAAEPARLAENGGPVTAFGDPGSPTPLPSARKEAELVGGAVHVGAAVTREAVLAALARPGMVHIACHGTFDSAAPLSSGLCLAGGDTLTVADLMGTRIRAELVVLTACGAARGSVTHGEDVIGLPRGLLVGGASAVIAPLWNVYDVPTARLAVALHRRLRAGEPVGAALRNAQDDMRGGGLGAAARHPGCWASLVVVGKPA